MTLKELCAKYKVGDFPDKDSVHSYIEVYEEILEPYRSTANNILEIGLMSGESLRMWRDYFLGDVYGIDCELKPLGGAADLTEAIADGLRIVIGDAANPKDIEKYFRELKFDVVIEDAQHNIEQQLEIYKTMKPYLAKDAIYIIEDVQNIDATKELFLNIDSEKKVEIIDRRNVLKRYDDCMIIIADK